MQVKKFLIPLGCAALLVVTALGGTADDAAIEAAVTARLKG